MSSYDKDPDGKPNNSRRTYFAPPERASAAELEEDIAAVSHYPLVDGLMYVASGLFAVLNKQRQIIALNESYLKMMGIEDPALVLGLRNGEYVRCIHACEMPDGCGTTPHCATCGAVIATMAALGEEKPQESSCAITVERDSKEVDLFFQVRCCPLTIQGNKFILMFLHDATLQQQRANLDGTFFHDINNLMTGLIGKADLFQRKEVWDSGRFDEIMKLLQRAVQELSMQQALSRSLSHTCEPLYCTVSANALLDDLVETFEGHPLCRQVDLKVQWTDATLTLLTDPAIVGRVLVNMVTNALEATEPGGEVRVFTEAAEGSFSFCVWNRKPIPREHALRIFRRNFTTKDGPGHGLGTYSMKFFGENVLGGCVNFTSSNDDGTLFRLTLTH